MTEAQDNPFSAALSFDDAAVDRQDDASSTDGSASTSAPIDEGPATAIQPVARREIVPTPQVRSDALSLLRAAGIIAPAVRRTVLTTQDGRRRLVEPNAGIRVGRNPEQVDLVIDDRMVSRCHCIVRVDPDKDGSVVEDLGSANGTWIHRSSQRIPVGAGEVVRLQDGDWIRSGDESILAHVSMAPDPSEVSRG